MHQDDSKNSKLCLTPSHHTKGGDKEIEKEIKMIECVNKHTQSQ